MPTLYAPGPTPVVVTPRGFVVLEPGTPATLAARIRSLVADGRGLGGVIEALTGAYGTSLTAIPSFAVVLSEGDAVRVAVRGAFSLDIAAAVSERITGVGVTTWTERVMPAVTSVTLAPPAGDDEAAAPAELPVLDAVVLASTVVWDASTLRSSAEPAGVQPAAVQPAASTPRPEVAKSRLGDDDTPAEASFTGVSSSRSRLLVSGQGDGPSEAEAPAVPVADAPPAVPPPTRGPWSPRPTPPAEPATPPLIDSRAVMSLADAETLVPSDSTIAPLEGSAPADGSADEQVWGETVVRPAEDAAGGEDTPAAPIAGDHDGETISLAQARAQRAAAAGGPATAPPLAPPRPPAPGRVRVSTGQVLLLDRTVVIGRRPRSTRVTGTDLPHLVAVDSPQQDISRSHLELRVEGESIVATDLHTTNGTTLLRSGAEPVRLHPGEGTIVVAGDVLDLGDGITVAIEALS